MPGFEAGMTGNHAEMEKLLMTKFAIIAAAALSILAVSIPAKAGSNCRTTCYMLAGQQVCDTRCN